MLMGLAFDLVIDSYSFWLHEEDLVGDTWPYMYHDDLIINAK